MRKVLSIICVIFVWALPAVAQEKVWLQIEAQPTLREAQDRARAYAGSFTDVNGFQLRSGWYAIALGPYSTTEAPTRLGELRRYGQVPRDAYISDGGNFRQQFWPVGAARTPTAQPDAPVTAPPATQTVLPAPQLDETPAQARRSERDLTREQRELLQEALKWEGFYASAIDGAFGPGTRNAMAAYQAAMGDAPTGILTTRQRDRLVTQYRAAFAALGLKTVEDSAAGIRITLPAAMVAFTSYEPPFVHYDSVGDSGVRVLLISQKGDQNTLFGLYDIMQTLEIVPLTGPRERQNNWFELTGQNATLHSYTYAALRDGMIKGFTLIWPPADEKRMTRVAQIMRDSFEPFGGALDETLGAPGAEQSVDLLSGLDIRRADRTRSGFYVDGAGLVLTTADVLDQCQRITIGDDTEAEVTARDDTLGLIVLHPRQRLAPMAYAAFQTGVPRLQSEVAVAGFSYGDALDLPVMTYGTLADLKGLAGEDGLNRLALSALPGDAGGPVFDQSGAVMGMLLPHQTGARQLPGDVSFAATVPAIADFLSANGVQMAASDRGGQIDPVDLAALAADMTVLVSCWN
ncbi:serine protease [Actibacterium sp. D379-3]